MHYLGGKMRLQKYIVPILQKNMRNTYIEPFVGAGWIFTNIDANIMIAGDNHPDLILMWNALLDGWTPPSNITEEEYQIQKYSEPSALRGFIGFASSFGGKWFGGYARDRRYPRSYTLNGYNSILKKVNRIKSKNVSFICSDYRDLDIPEDSIIYADPPYNGFTGYHNNKFDSSLFWKWCREQRVPVFISEYSAPDDFIPIATFTTKTDLKNENNKPISRIEKLFIHENKIDDVVGLDGNEKGVVVYAANQCPCS